MEKKNLSVNIRRTAQNDIGALMAIFDEARRTIAALGIDQWQDGYPNTSVIESDVEKEYSHCAELISDSTSAVCATFALVGDGDPCYDKIFDGAWLTNAGTSSLGRDIGYLAIHRVAISVSCRGCGIASQIMAFASDYAKKLGKNSLRIDTHEGNVVMRRMLEKQGFTHCGTIYLANGDKRVAYEKVLVE
jgi:GNAT superfamily N-acetyltransferase